MKNTALIKTICLQKISMLGLLLLLTCSRTFGLSIGAEEAYAPYSYKENGQLTGIYTDIIRSALKQMGDPSQPQPLPWKRGLIALKSGKIDALYPPYYRPQQRPYMAYSTPILEEKLVIVCAADKAETLSQFPQDYQGMVLGQNAGYSSGSAVEQAVQSGTVKISEANTTRANLLKLISGRIDCYINDSLSIRYELAKMQKAGEYNGSGIKETHTLSVEQGYLAINTNASEKVKAFIQRFNKAITDMKASGEIDAIINRYLQ